MPKSKGEEDLIEDAVIKAYMKLAKVINNENRAKILVLLDKKPRSWTDLMFTARVSPKVLRDHLNILTRHHLINKSGKIYQITDTGRAFLRMTLPMMIKIAKFAKTVTGSIG